MPRKKQNLKNEKLQEKINDKEVEKNKNAADEKKETKRKNTINTTKKETTGKKAESIKETKTKTPKDKKEQEVVKEPPKTRKKAQPKNGNEKKEEIAKTTTAARNKKGLNTNQEPKTTKQKQSQTKTSKTTTKQENKKETTAKKTNKVTVKKENKEKLSQKEILKMQEVVEQEIKNKKKLPPVELSKIYKNVFKQLCFAIAIMIYFNFILLGFINIENSVFLTDLKVFSVSIFVVAIAVIEYAYKKESGKHAIHGIEILVLSLITLGLVYLNIMENNKFIAITALISYIYAIYYIAKAMIIYTKMKKQSSIEKIKEMISKDNVEE